MSTPSAAESPPRPTLAFGLLILLGVLVAIAGYIAIGQALGLAPLYAGFLLLWYWSTFDKLDFRAAPATIAGALAGVGTAWLLQAVTESASMTGIIAVLLLIVSVLFLHIMGWVTFLFNPAFFLFLTIATAPLLQGGEDFGHVAAAMLLGCAYFGALLFVGTRLFAGGSGKPDSATQRA